MTPPVVDEQALEEALFKSEQEASAQMGEPFTRQDFEEWSKLAKDTYEEHLMCMRCGVEAYLTHAPQPDLQKLITQMEGLKSQSGKPSAHNRAIDRCIALVREMV